MKRGITSDISENVYGEKFIPELGMQPRKSNNRRQKYSAGSDDDNVGQHHSHRREPAKNSVRVELRRIQRLFN